MENVDGVLLVDKDPEMTSHDVVSVARKTLGQKKIGHCGTLDPMATGLLILTLGRGTKIQDLLMAEDKEYIGTVRLGEETTTQDKQGEIIKSEDVPELNAEEILSVLKEFTGDFYQTPPMVSAIKKDGVPLYKLARQGKEVKLSNPHQMGLGGLVASRFEWRWEYRGPRHWPRGAKTCIEWSLREQTGFITNLEDKSNWQLRVIQPEQIWFCAYGTKSYKEVCEFWRKTWAVRTSHD